MDLLREKLRCTPMGAVLRKGEGGRTDSPTTTNTDRRAALQDAVQVTEGSSANVTMISQSADADVLKAAAGANADAVKAMSNAGAQVLENVGGAIVDLNRDTVAANTKSWDALMRSGGDLVDKLIDANTETTGKVVAAYRPVDGNNADVAKWGVAAAAAAVIGAVLLKGK